MKSFYVFAASLMLTSGLFAQVSGYDFSQSISTYSALSEGTVISEPGWDDDIYGIELPFSFNYVGVDQDSLYVSDGYVYFSGKTLEEIAVMDADLIDIDSVNAKSTISYLVEGNSPNMIFKLEWASAGFFEDTIAYEDSTHFQLWLFENRGRIEMHYGSSSVKNAFKDQPGPRVGLSNYDNSQSIFLAGSPAEPTTAANPQNNRYLDAMPADGTVYSFSPQFVGASQNVTPALSVYPNPATDRIFISHPGTSGQLLLIAPSGQTVYEYAGQLNQISVDVSTLSEGVYFAQIRANGAVATEKVLVR